MKFGELRSIGHNIADSLASGFGALAGVSDVDIFAEAKLSPERFIEVDFLTGTARGGRPSPTLARAVGRYGQALSLLCRRHGVSVETFRRLSARYSTVGRSRTVIVTVEDHEGRRAVDEYVGSPGARPRILDPLGRIRTWRTPVVRAKPEVLHAKAVALPSRPETLDEG